MCSSRLPYRDLTPFAPIDPACPTGDIAMPDILFLALGGAVFAVLALYARALGRV
jgi:hypothetical protein